MPKVGRKQKNPTVGAKRYVVFFHSDPETTYPAVGKVIGETINYWKVLGKDGKEYTCLKAACTKPDLFSVCETFRKRIEKENRKHARELSRGVGREGRGKHAASSSAPEEDG